MNRILTVSLIAAFTSGCAIGPADYNDKPNSIQRAEVMSKNAKGITVEHSDWGKKIAFRLADEHCATQNKVATYLGSSSQYGPDVVSTWRCE